MRKRPALWIAATIGLAAFAPANAQEPGSRQTHEFVQSAGQADQFEILEADTVLTGSSDAQIRAFAQRMIQDHGEISRTLEQATARAGLKPPPKGISADQALLLGELQSLRERALDQAYLRHQALAHHSALVVERMYAATGDNLIVRQAAASATPIISAHLDMAEQMRAKMDVR